MMLTLEQNLRYAGKFYGLHDEDIKKRINELAQQFELQDLIFNKKPQYYQVAIYSAL